MEKGFKKVACEIMSINPRSYSNYAEQKRPIIKLLEQYFTKDDLEEFINTGKISKQELIRDLSFRELKMAINYTKDEIILKQIEELKSQLSFNKS